MKYDVKRMYKQAHEFQLAGERCLLEIPNENGSLENLPIQAIVCFAFACEIYLKTILYWEKPSQEMVRSHKISSLFKMVSEKRRMEICEDLKRIYNEADIERYILQADGIFEDYRYVYERDSESREHVGFVQSFAIALENVVGRITWIDVLKMSGMDEKTAEKTAQDFRAMDIVEEIRKYIVS